MLGRVRRKAFAAASEAYRAASEGRDLIADLQDGFGVTIVLDDHAVGKMIHMVSTGRGGELPLTIKIDPTIDADD